MMIRHGILCIIKYCITVLQEVLKIGQSKGIRLSHLSSHEIESKLADTLNGEVIEPMLRVWRAYRYGTRHPQCDRYVICAVNQHDPSADQGAGLRPGITKLARYVPVLTNILSYLSYQSFNKYLYLFWHYSEIFRVTSYVKTMSIKYESSVFHGSQYEAYSLLG
jgi:hypothetical protein